MVLWCEHFGDEFGKQHQRICDENEHLYDSGGRHGERTPVGCSDGLRDYLGENKNQQSQNSRDNAEVLLTENLDGLRSHTGRTDGVGYGIERKNSADRTVHVVLVSFHQCGSIVALVFLHRNIRHRSGKKHRLKDGTKERK